MSEAAKLSGINVLIVDDSEVMQTMLAYMLKEEGATATIAENGEIAVDCVKETKFDVILMDLQMPKCDGVEATKRIRALGVNAPIIAVTAAPEEEVKSLTEIGFSFVSHKPVEFEKLIKLINMFV